MTTMLGNHGCPPNSRSMFRVTTCPNPEVARAYPYGIYDLARNAGFVNVGS